MTAAAAIPRRWGQTQGRGRNLILAGPEWAAVALLAGAVVAWQVPTRGWSALDAAPFALGLAYGVLVLGRLIGAALRLPLVEFGGLTLVIVVGFLAVNTLILGVALVVPLRLPVVALGVAGGVLAWAWVAPARADRPPAAASRGLGCLAFCLLAATLWSVDSIAPTSTAGGSVVFHPWADSYTHAGFIRAFRDLQGLGSLQHPALAGERPPVYHYAGFVVPALLAATSNCSCYLAFAAFLVPLGVALTGLAAASLGRWWFGPGADLAASVGLLAIPDATHQAIANPYLGYHWLALTGPTWLYGLVCITVAWALVLEGSRRGRYGLVAIGFGVAGLSVAYKAHLFVAVAWLIAIYPALACPGVTRWARLGWLGGVTAMVALVARWSWAVPGVPLLRLDGSGRKLYLAALNRNLLDPAWRGTLAVDDATTPAHDLAVGLVHIAGGSLGALAFVAPALALVLLVVRGAGGLDRAARVPVALWPILVLGNYLVMALGLALDDRTAHMPDELLHRPLVWAYFAVMAWTAAGVWAVALRPGLARLGLARRAGPLVVVALLGVPLYLGREVQVGPPWGRDFTSMRVPVGLVRSAEFLRERADRAEVVQNSDPDGWNILSALAERPVFVANTWRVLGRQTNPTIVGRLAEVEQFCRLTDPAAIAAFAHERRIAWFVLDPATPVRWPATVRDHPAFEAGGFRVYHFPSGPVAP